MYTTSFNWRNVVAIAICSVVLMIFNACDKTSDEITKDDEITTTKGGDKPTQNPVELKSPITENTTLKALGLPVDYIYTGNNLLSVENNAILTIEPGVTIQFTNNGRGGGIIIKSGSTIKAVGTADKRIRFIGAYEAKGTWGGINLESKTDNQFVYCDLLNAGYLYRTDCGAMYLVNGAQVGISHCKFTNGGGCGLVTNYMDYGGVCQISAFDNNVFEDFEGAPVHIGNLKQLEKFDMTSDFTKNKYPYIAIFKPLLGDNVTLNETTVPYYFGTGSGNKSLNLTHILTINAGITIYMGDSQAIEGTAGKLIVKGTAAKKVKFTRYPGDADYYWSYVSFGTGLKGSVIEHCILEYGGRTGTNDGIILINQNTDLTLNNVEINNSEHYGVLIGNCGYILTHSNVTFSGNRDGNVWDKCNGGLPGSVVRTHFP